MNYNVHTIEIEENHISAGEIADRFAEKLTQEFEKYQLNQEYEGDMKKLLKRYKLGQYQMILNALRSGRRKHD